MDSYKGRHWKRALKGPGTACTMDKWVPERMKPETSLEDKRTEWKLSYFGHVARRQGSSDEMLTLGKQRWQGEETRHERGSSSAKEAHRQESSGEEQGCRGQDAVHVTRAGSRWTDGTLHPRGKMLCDAPADTPSCRRSRTRAVASLY